MAHTIITKNSSTAGAVPSAGSLTKGELAVNVTDRRLYTKDNAGSVVELGSGTSIIYRDNFTGDGSTVAFTLPRTPLNEELVDIYCDGVYQGKDTFSISGAVITFDEAPLAGASIEVMTFQSSPIGETAANYVSYTPAGTSAVATTVQSKLRETVSVKDYGAVCDGVTDDTAAIQAAIDAAPTSKAIYFPGMCLTSAPLTFAHNSLVKLCGTGTSGITNNTSDLFTVDCGLTLFVEDLQLVSGASGGHIINLLSPRAGASYSGLSQSTFTNITARVSNTTKSVIHMGGTTSIYIDNLWLNFNIFNTASHAAHTFNFVGGGGSVGANKWLRGRITYGTIHAFRFECTETSSYLYDNTLESINFEVLNGGAVKGIGVNGLVVRDCFIYDVNLTGTIDDHVIYLDKVSGGQPSRAVKIENFYRRSSSLNTGIKDIYCATGGVNLMVIDLVAVATVSGFSIDLNSATNVTILGITSSTNIYNASSTTTYVEGGALGVGVRPTAGTTNVCVNSGVTFPSTQAPNSDVNTLDDYREGTFTGSLTGCDTVPTGSITYTKVGNLVTLDIPTISGTSNATSATITGMPSSLYPSAARTVLFLVENNGTVAVGRARIQTSGTITLYPSPTGSTFTASGSKGAATCNLSYLI